MSLTNVADLTRAGIGDEKIIAAIRGSGTVYRMTGQEIVWLAQNGVHDCVIQAMQATALSPPVIFVHEPPPPVGFGVVVHGK